MSHFTPWAVGSWPQGAPKSVVTPRHLCSVVRAFWNGCGSGSGQHQGREGGGGMGWGQFGWRGSHDSRSPIATITDKNSSKLRAGTGWKTICQHTWLPRSVRPQRALPSASCCLRVGSSWSGIALRPVFSPVTPPWVTSSYFYNLPPKQYLLSDGCLLTRFWSPFSLIHFNFLAILYSM